MNRRRFLGLLAAAPAAALLPSLPLASGGKVSAEPVIKFLKHPPFRIFVPRSVYNAARHRLNEYERRIFVPLDLIPRRSGKTMLAKHFEEKLKHG